MKMTDCDAVILAGGHSRRMGRCKALLELGGERVLDRLARELSGFHKLWISLGTAAVGGALPGQAVWDCYPDCGPLAGLHAALRAAEADYLFCVPCDLPYMTGAVGRRMLEDFPPDVDARVCGEAGGRVQPLCGISAKSALPVLERRLEAGQLRAGELLTQLRYSIFPVEEYFPSRVLFNMNTPEDYRRVLREE